MKDRPIRIQRQRTKGWEMPCNTIYVGRGSKWGNPFKVSDNLKREDAVNRYKECALNNVMAYYYFDEIVATEMFSHFNLISKNLYILKGKNLACWCPIGVPCHADVLLEYANKC